MIVGIVLQQSVQYQLNVIMDGMYVLSVILAHAQLKGANKMEIIYDGLLSKDTLGYIESMAAEYPNAVEVTCADFPWQHFHFWKEQVLPLYPVAKENCMGQAYIKETHMFGIVSNEGDSDVRFYFFKTDKEKQDFISEFSDHIIDTDPFKVIVKIAC